MKPLLSLVLPLKVKRSAKKWFILNLNQYRNLHYRTLSATKRTYHGIVLKLLSNRKSKINKTPLVAHYKYYHGSKRRVDVMNPISIIEKYTMDAIVGSGVIPDDNTDIIKAYYIESCGVDKDNPRAELRLYEYDAWIKEHNL